MTNLPPMEGLASVLEALKAGSLTAAADELGITHGAVSRRIKLVEDWFGVRIFERHGRGVRLTAEGALVARRVERLIGGLKSAASDIRAARAHGAIKISVLPSFAKLWLVHHLRELEGSAELSFQVNTTHSIVRLDGRECDLAVRSGYGDWTGVVAEKLFGERLFPVASPEVATRIGSEESSIFSHPLLHDGDSAAWRKWAEAAGRDYAPIAGERRFADYDLVLAAAKAGLGIALARMPLAEESLNEGGLVRLKEPAIEIGRGHWLVMRPGEERASVLLAAERLLAISARLRS